MLQQVRKWEVSVVVKIWSLWGSRHVSVTRTWTCSREPILKSLPPSIWRHHSSTVLRLYCLPKALWLWSKGPAMRQQFPPSQQQIGINLQIAKAVMHLYLPTQSELCNNITTQQVVEDNSKSPLQRGNLNNLIQFQRLQGSTDSNWIVNNLYLSTSTTTVKYKYTSFFKE